MNSKKQSLVICFLVIGLFVSSCGSKQSAKLGEIEGTVYYSKSNPKTPVANATVKLQKPGSAKAIAEVPTDKEGHYSFTNVEPGTYDLASDVHGCVTLYFGATGKDKIKVTAGNLVIKDLETPCRP